MCYDSALSGSGVAYAASTMLEVKPAKTVRQFVLEQAIKCVCGDREKDYGTPEDNFKVIANLWTAYFGQEFTAVDVAVFLSLVKIGRISSGHGKEDNWIDLAGYAACGAEIEQREAEREAGQPV